MLTGGINREMNESDDSDMGDGDEIDLSDEDT